MWTGSVDALLTVYGSFNHAVSVASNDLMIVNVVNYELECLRKEAVVAHFKSLSCSLPERAE
jgi:hypothetical protein